MSAYFVTASGTDIGKTFVTAGIIRHLRQAGQTVSALKPVVCSFDFVRLIQHAMSDGAPHLRDVRARRPLLKDVALAIADTSRPTPIHFEAGKFGPQRPC
jgi:hypothetical protein